MDAIKVKQLKELIAGLPDDMPVVLQKDSEGNGYDTAYGIKSAYIVNPGERDLEVIDAPDPGDEDRDNLVPCLLIYP